MQEIDALRAVEHLLTESRDKEFAASLLRQAARRDLSDKQMFYVRKLTAVANGTNKPRTIGITTNVAAIVAIFDRARQHKPWPKIYLRHDGGGEYLLTLAGERSSAPGSINVKSAESGGEWYGRILRNGTFAPHERVTDDALAALVTTLRAFAADPAGIAAQYGQETKRCCFCRTRLTNDGSREVGYGPDCAATHGLPWTGKASGAPDRTPRRNVNDRAPVAINSDIAF